MMKMFPESLGRFTGTIFLRIRQKERAGREPALSQLEKEVDMAIFIFDL
jgi:hypothetical protein